MSDTRKALLDISGASCEIGIDTAGNITISLDDGEKIAMDIVEAEMIRAGLAVAIQVALEKEYQR